jgi:hypothetical protein
MSEVILINKAVAVLNRRFGYENTKKFIELMKEDKFTDVEKEIQYLKDDPRKCLVVPKED